MAAGLSVYIGYHIAAVSFALELATDLRNEGVNVYLDRLDYDGNRSWDHSNELRLERANIFIPIITTDYLTSQYGKAELLQAQTLERTIIPVNPYSFDLAQYPAQISDDTINFEGWSNPTLYQERFGLLVDRIETKTAKRLPRVRDPRSRYLHQLLAAVEQHKAQLEGARFLPSSATSNTASTRLPSSVPQDWGYNATFILQQHGRPDREIPLPEVDGQLTSYILLGDLGHGKTTALYRLLGDSVRARLHDEEDIVPLPYFLSLADWDGDQKWDTWLNQNWQAGGKDVVSRIRTGEVRLFLDGLDEIPATQRADKIAQIRGWLQEHPEQRVVFTMDRAIYDSELDLEITRIVVTPPNSQVILQPAQAYLTSKGTDDPNVGFFPAANPQDVQAWQWSHRNPLAMTTLIHLRQMDNHVDLPRDMGHLLLLMIEKKWDIALRDGDPNWASHDKMLNAVLNLAYKMTDDAHSVSIPATQAVAWVQDENLFHGLVSAGILSHHNERVRFRHPMVQYALSGHRLNQASGDIHTLLRRPQLVDGKRAAQYWDVPIIFQSTFTESADQFIRMIGEVDPFLALDCCQIGNHVSDKTEYQAMNRLLEFIGVEDEAARESGLEKLYTYYGSGAADVLLGWLRGGEWKRRELALDMLLTLPLSSQSEAQAELIESLRSKDANRPEQFEVLKSYPFAETLYALCNAQKTADPSLRSVIATSLGALQDQACAVPLIRALRDPDESVRVAAALAFANTKDTSNLDQFALTLQDESSDVRMKVANSMTRIGLPAIPELLSVAGDTDVSGDIRRLAIASLAHIKHSVAEHGLKEIAKNADTDILAAALKALGTVGTDVSVEVLQAALDNDARPSWLETESSVKDIARESLVKIGTATAQAVLAVADGVESPVTAPEITNNDTESLDSLPADVPVFGPNINTRDIKILNLGDDHAVTEWEAGIASDDWVARKRTVERMRSSGSPSALPLLLKLLASDPNDGVRLAIINALPYFNDNDQIIPALEKSVQDSNVIIGQKAAYALVERNAYATIRTAITNATDELRARLVKALAEFGDERSVSILKIYVQDTHQPIWTDKTIGQFATEGLERIRSGIPNDNDLLQQYQATLDDDSVVILDPSSLPPTIPATKAPVSLPPPPGHNEATMADELERLSNESTPAQAIMDDVNSLLDPGKKKLTASIEEVSIDLDDLSEPHKTHAYTKLYSALEDKEDTMLRYVVVQLLATTTGPHASEAMQHIAECLNDPSPLVRATAVVAIAKIGGEKYAPLLAPKLQDKSLRVREMVARSLGKLGNPNVVNDLLRALDNNEYIVQLMIIDALGKLQDTRATLSLIGLMDSPHNDVRWHTMRALYMIADPNELDVLHDHLFDDYQPAHVIKPERRIQDFARRTLEKIGTPTALGIMQQYTLPLIASGEPTNEEQGV